MVDIQKYLVPKVPARFGDRPIELAVGTEFKMIFPCIHPKFGDVLVSDDRDEVTVFCGRFTHVHFYDRGWPDEQYESDDDWVWSGPLDE